MRCHNRNMDIEKKYVYEDDEGVKQYDFCESCNKPVLQEDLGDGIYGCEYCKSANQITINEIEPGYKLFCLQNEKWFAGDSRKESPCFETFEDILDQLISYHQDVEKIDKMELWEICETFDWEIRNAQTLERVEPNQRKFKCRECGEKYIESFCSTEDVSICRWCSGEEQ